MMTERPQQRTLFDVGNVFRLQLDPRSFHAQLAQAAPRLFRDQDFAALYHQDRGRPSVPPSQLALLTLLQHHAGCSDQEAVERSGYDLRWAAVLGRAGGAPLCAKSTLQLFRSQLVIHEAARKIFTASIAEARQAGLLKRQALRIALDTKPIVGRGAVQDTYNLLATGIGKLIRALAAVADQTPAEWGRQQDLGRYFAPSLKGSAELDWSDPEARQRFLAEIVADARRLLRLAGAAASADPCEKIRPAAQLLEALLLQDVVEQPAPVSPAPAPGEPPEPPSAQLKQGTSRDRMPSASDPEQRHGRKSQSQRFNGHKARVAADTESQIILEVEVLPGNAGDAEGALQQVERVEENSGQAVAETIGDCAFGSGQTRQQFAAAGRELVAQAPQEGKNGGRFPKSLFMIDLEQGRVTCPAGEVSEKFTRGRDGGQLFHFGQRCQGCRLRAQCTRAKQGRQIRVHPQERLLRAARARQQTPEGKAQLRRRVVVEHCLARLGQLGIGQARYRGRRQTLFQLLMAATVANLRWTWNWQAKRAGAGDEAVKKSGQSVLSGALAAIRGRLDGAGGLWGRFGGDGGHRVAMLTPTG